MERILKEFSYLDDEMFGSVCKLAFLYVDGVEFPADTDSKTEAFFYLYVRKKLDCMMKQRQRTKKNKEAKRV